MALRARGMDRQEVFYGGHVHQMREFVQHEAHALYVAGVRGHVQRRVPGEYVRPCNGSVVEYELHEARVAVSTHSVPPSVAFARSSKCMTNQPRVWSWESSFPFLKVEIINLVFSCFDNQFELLEFLKFLRMNSLILQIKWIFKTISLCIQSL